MEAIGASGTNGTLGGAVVNASAKPADGPLRLGAGSSGAHRLWPPGARPIAAGSPRGSALISVRRTPRWLLTRIRRVLGFGVMHASAPLRNRSGEPIRARAWLESALIEEKYQYSQEISLNADVHEVGEPACDQARPSL